MVHWSSAIKAVTAQFGDKMPTTQRCRLIILEAITSGHLPPATRLIEAELGSALSVSRTPLREALVALKAEGILRHDEDGLRVRQLAWSDVKNLYDMRATLEGMAARLAAEIAGPAERKALSAIATEEIALISQGAAPLRLAEHNARFHAAILAAAQNPFLADALGRLSRLMVLLGATAYRLPERVDAIAKEHEAIHKAISNQNGNAAEQAMKTHLENALQARLILLSETKHPVMD